jgi:hypothetical protein
VSNTIDVSVAVPLRRVLDIICNALDSGAFGYWIDRKSLDEVIPQGWTLDDVEWLTPSDRDFWRGVRRSYFAPLIEGGALIFREDDDDATKMCRLDLASIRSGLEVMAKTYPGHFANIVGENDDATTADIFVQCCVLGGVVYG